MAQRFHARQRRGLCDTPGLRVAGNPTGTRTVAISDSARVHAKLEPGVVVGCFAHEVEATAVLRKGRAKFPERETTPTQNAMRSGNLCRAPIASCREQEGLRGLFALCVPSQAKID